MKKVTKDYLKFCGINSIIISIGCYKIYKRLIEDGYEIVKNEKSIEEHISNIAELVFILLTPIYNVVTSAQFILILENEDFYNIIKNRLISRNFIEIKENSEENVLNNNTINEPFRKILNDIKDENNKVKEKK